MSNNVIPVAGVTISLLLLVVFAIACSPAKSQYTLADFCKSDGSPYHKIDNPDARNVSYDELLSALATIPQKYDFTSTTGNCGHYTEATHNELEAMGVKAAICFVFLPEYSFTHVFNAFDTTDRGRVYVNITNGAVATAQKINGKYMVIRHLPDQIQTQELGYEKDFIIFW